MDLIKRKAFIDRLAARRGGRIYHYTEALKAIEPGILPLVKVFETIMTTPIFSCAGHWDEKSEPNVMFVVLPGKKALFQKFLDGIMVSTPDNCHTMEFSHSYRCKRYGYGPFIDWHIEIKMPWYQICSARKYEAVRNELVQRYAKYLKARFAGLAK